MGSLANFSELQCFDGGLNNQFVMAKFKVVGVGEISDSEFQSVRSSSEIESSEIESRRSGQFVGKAEC